MTKKAAQCTRHCAALVLSNPPPLLSPLFLISFDIPQSFLLDLCLCDPLSLLLGVECNSFCSSVHLFTCITPQIISLSISSCGASLLITVVWLMDLWILDLLLPHSSNFSCPGSFLFVCYLWLIVMSIFLHFCSTLTLLIDVSLFSVESLGQTHFSPFPLHSKGTALGKHGSLLLIIERV